MIKVKYIMFFAAVAVFSTSVVVRALARHRFSFLIVAMCFMLGLFFGVLFALCTGEANFSLLFK